VQDACIFFLFVHIVQMSNKQPIKNKGGRPLANTHRIHLTLAQDDYDLLKDIASMTSTKPSTMVRDIILDNRAMLLGLRDALRASIAGETDSLTGLASKLLAEVHVQANDAQQELGKVIKK